MTRKHAKPAAIVFCTALLAASPAEANAMLPVFGLAGLGMVVLLVPIIVIESLVAGFYLGISAWSAIKVASVGNLASTVVGIPMTGIVLIFVAAFGGRRTERFFDALFTTPTEDWVDEEATEDWDEEEATDRTTEQEWVDGIISLFVLFVLFFLASWGIEYGIAVAMVDERMPSAVNAAILVANAVTYGLLCAYFLAALLVEWNQQRRAKVAHERAPAIPPGCGEPEPDRPHRVRLPHRARALTESRR